MISNEETAQNFKAELSALLAKYGAVLSAKDHYEGYPECGEDVRITVELQEPYIDIDLGNYYRGEK